jgi:ABC-2 type transport system ATP-binding protein
MSIVLASHILVDVERTCQRVVIMHRGKVAKEGDMEGVKGTYSDAFTVRIEGDQESFIQSLKKKKCDVTVDQQIMDITLPKGKGTDLILKTAKDAKVQIRKLVPSIQTLEDVFVKLLEEEPHADL